MRKDGFMKSGIYRVLDYIARLVILNVLILIISFLLLLIFKDQKWPLIITALTFLPSIVSAFKVIKDYEDGNRGPDAIRQSQEVKELIKKRKA